jgi:dimethylargininase
MNIAITRKVSPSMDRCELSYMAREPIDFPLAESQHGEYEACLEALGCRVVSLPALPDLPDSVFVEDTAIVLDELAILTRPGADSRKPETRSMAKTLAAYRTLVEIRAPGTIDGGDVLRVDKTIYIGISRRTNAEAIRQVRDAVRPHGYEVIGVPVTGCLHLKTAATLVAPQTMLGNRAWMDHSPFQGLEWIDTDEREPFAGNGLLIGDSLVYPSNFPRTRERLEQRGIRTYPLNISEVIKAEGAVTCCSVVFND